MYDEFDWTFVACRFNDIYVLLPVQPVVANHPRTSPIGDLHEFLDKHAGTWLIRVYL